MSKSALLGDIAFDTRVRKTKTRIEDQEEIKIRYYYGWVVLQEYQRMATEDGWDYLPRNIWWVLWYDNDTWYYGWDDDHEGGRFTNYNKAMNRLAQLIQDDDDFKL